MDLKDNLNNAKEELKDNVITVVTMLQMKIVLKMHSSSS